VGVGCPATLTAPKPVLAVASRFLPLTLAKPPRQFLSRRVAPTETRICYISLAGLVHAPVPLCHCATLQGPSKHAGRTYHINSAPFTQTAVAAAFSSELGRPVDYVQVPEEGVLAALKGFGMEQWQADGCVELNRYVTGGQYSWASDFEAIVGRPATTLEEYVKAIASSGAF